MIIVDSHHKALAAWALLRSRLNSPPRLLTLDHHTDTSPPFRNLIKKIHGPDYSGAEELRSSWLSEIDYRDQATVQAAIDRLGNDEHVVAAIRSDIISSALVVAHNAYDTDLSVYREHKIVCRSILRTPDSKKLVRSAYDQVLESNFLDSVLADFDKLLAQACECPLRQEPYILDIDLDYLNTFASVSPQNSKTIRALAQGAELITIATEPEYVKTCSLDAGLTSEMLLSSLSELIKN